MEKSRFRRCWGLNRNFRRCGRFGSWIFFCDDHRLQPFGWAFSLVFTVIAGIASIQSAWFAHLWTRTSAHEPSIGSRAQMGVARKLIPSEPKSAGVPSSKQPSSAGGRNPKPLNAQSQIAIGAPRIEIGFALGAEMLFSRTMDCATADARCYSERELQNRIFDFDSSHWRRIIYRFRNLGRVKLIHPHLHIEADDLGVAIFHPDQRGLDRGGAEYVMEDDIADIAPYHLAQAYTAYPVDVIVKPNIGDFSIVFKMFGENMAAHQVEAHFKVMH